MEQKEWEMAKQHLETAVEIGSNSNDEFRYIEALEALGDYFLKQGKVEEAIYPYQVLSQTEKKYRKLL